MESAEIDELERKWRRAYLDFDRTDSLLNHVREKEAWKALSDAKVAYGMCLAPGCRNIEGRMYCSKHREHDE